MRVLIAIASRHGSTRAVADALGRALNAEGVETQIADTDEIDDPSDFDGVIVGSAVYFGKWMKSAKTFARKHSLELQRHPTWIFSCGALGDPPKPDQMAASEIHDLMVDTWCL